MDFNTYTDKALSTAIYPFKGCGNFIGAAYPILKLAGEAGEVAEKMGKYIRDELNDDQINALIKVLGLRGEIANPGGFKEEVFTDEFRLAMIKELGDVLWYINAVAYELGYSLEDVAQINIDKLQARTLSGTLKGSGDER